MPIIDFDKIKENFSLYNHRPRVFSWPIFGTIIMSAGLFILYKLNQYIDPWITWRQAMGNATNFCEMNRFDQLIVQPSNTWSNLGFIIIGLIFIGIAKNDHKYEQRKEVNNLLARFPGFTFLIGFSTLYMGIGSFMYHATLTFFFQKMDQTGMYFLLIAFIAYMLFKIFPVIRWKGKEYVSNRMFIAAAFVVQLFFFLFLWKLPINLLFPSLTIIFILANIYMVTKMQNFISNMKLILAAAATFLIAASVWILDITDKLCSPASVFQGHSLWHLLTALSVFFAYMYYRSEEYLTPEEQDVV